MLHLFSTPQTPAVIGMANNMYTPMSPSETKASDIVSMIEQNPDSVSAGFCYSPLVCIGKNIQFGDGPVANLLLMSPCGYLVVVSAKSFNEGSIVSVTKDSENMDAELQHVTFDTLDDICIEYTHNRFSEVDDIIGAMSDAGYLDAEDESMLKKAVNKNLSNSKFMYISVVKDAPDFVMDERFSLAFLCVNTYRSSSESFAVLNLRRIEAD